MELGRGGLESQLRVALALALDDFLHLAKLTFLISEMWMLKIRAM